MLLFIIYKYIWIIKFNSLDDKNHKLLYFKSTLLIQFAFLKSQNPYNSVLMDKQYFVKTYQP